jgi:hypothetical protein
MFQQQYSMAVSSRLLLPALDMVPPLRTAAQLFMSSNATLSRNNSAILSRNNNATQYKSSSAKLFKTLSMSRYATPSRGKM